MKGGICGENLKRHEYRYGLIGKELLRQAKAANEALKDFGRFMVYDADNYIFKLNRSKLDRWATQYADDLE